MKKKLIIINLFLLLLLMSLLVYQNHSSYIRFYFDKQILPNPSGEELALMKDWNTYSDSKVGIEFKYPKNWKALNESQSEIVFYNENDFAIGGFNYELRKENKINKIWNRKNCDAYEFLHDVELAKEVNNVPFICSNMKNNVKNAYLQQMLYFYTPEEDLTANQSMFEVLDEFSYTFFNSKYSFVIFKPFFDPKSILEDKLIFHSIKTFEPTR